MGFVCNTPSSFKSCSKFYNESSMTVLETVGDAATVGENAEEKCVTTDVNSLVFARQIAALNSAQGYHKSFYVMDMPKLEELIKLWTDCFPRVRPFYAINCNSNPVLLQLLANSNLFGFTCKTARDLSHALKFLSAEKILFSNPVWSRPALKQAAEKDIQLLDFESVHDLKRIMLHHPTAELLLHVSMAESEADDPAVNAGCMVGEAAELFEYAANCGANVTGISFNLGGGCTQPELYENAIKVASELFQIGTTCGFGMQRLNLGAGFSHTNEMFLKICERINVSLDMYFPTEHYDNLQVMATPGRFFAKPVFSLVTNIVDRRSVDLKEITNDDWDAGREAYVYKIDEGYYSSFGCCLNENVEPEHSFLDNFLDSTEQVYSTVIGPTVDDMDVVQSLRQFRPLSQGDWLIWENMGAYSMNNVGTLSDDVDEDETPNVFYFTPEEHWKRFNLKLADAAEGILTPNDDDVGAEVAYVGDNDSLPSDFSSVCSDAEQQIEEDANECENIFSMIDWFLLHND